MIFFVVMPGLYGVFGNFLIPILFGTSEVVFPRLNLLSLVFFVAAFKFLVTLLYGEFGDGWG